MRQFRGNQTNITGKNERSDQIRSDMSGKKRETEKRSRQEIETKI